MTLKNTPRHSHQLRFCDKCERKQPPEGGVQIGPGRWYCSQCWLKRRNKEQGK